MGQRHQVYIIKNNKCVAALHHQWLYGRGPLTNLASLLDCLKTGDSPNKALENAYKDGIILTKEEFDPEGADNNDGITVVDITDSSDFKYCFMNIDHLEGEIEPPKFVPLSAKEYVQCYYPELGPEELRAIRGLKDYNLIATDTIKATWVSIQKILDGPDPQSYRRRFYPNFICV